MKKNQARCVMLLLSVALLLAMLCACGPSGHDPGQEQTKPTGGMEDLVETPTNPPVSSEILTMASQGKLMPISQGQEALLGMPVMQVWTDYYNEDPQEQNTSAAPYFQYENARFYYVDSGDKPICAILYQADPYDLVIGLTEPQELIDALGEPKSKGDTQVDLMGYAPDSVYALSYAAGENMLHFYFDNDALIATKLEKK